MPSTSATSSGPQERRLLEPGALGGVAHRLLRQRVAGADGREREQRGTQGTEADADEQGDEDHRRDLDQRQRVVDERALVHLGRQDPGDADPRRAGRRAGRCRPD